MRINRRALLLSGTAAVVATSAAPTLAIANNPAHHWTVGPFQGDSWDIVHPVRSVYVGYCTNRDGVLSLWPLERHESPALRGNQAGAGDVEATNGSESESPRLPARSDS